MRVLTALCAFGIFSVSSVLSNPVDERPAAQTLDKKENGTEIVAAENLSSNTREKKSATTTFCVEMRPSDPHQKTYQVCDPDYPAATAPYEAPAPAASYHQPASPSYVAPATTYHHPSASAPLKSYPAAAPGPKTYVPTHNPSSYHSYRNAGEKANKDQGPMHMARMTEEFFDEVEAEDTNGSKMRKATYYSPQYGAGYADALSAHYGASSTFVPAKPKQHSGLVITCQPSLAGYAHGIGAAEYGGSGGYVSYRSSNEYARPYSYGSYSQAAVHRAPTIYVAAPSYATPESAYKFPAHGMPSYGPTYSSPAHAALASAYKVQSYSAPASGYNALAPSTAVYSPYKLPTNYPAPVQSYKIPAPSYKATTSTQSASAVNYDTKDPSYNAPAPVYSDQAPSYAPSYNIPAPSYSAPAPSYGVSAPNYSASSYSAPAASYSAPSYSDPAPSYSAAAPASSYSTSSSTPTSAASTYSAPAAPAYAPAASAQSYAAPAPMYDLPKYKPIATYAESAALSHPAAASSYSPPSYKPSTAYAPAPSYGYRAADQETKDSSSDMMHEKEEETRKRLEIISKERAALLRKEKMDGQDEIASGEGSKT